MMKHKPTSYSKRTPAILLKFRMIFFASGFWIQIRLLNTFMKR